MGAARPSPGPVSAGHANVRELGGHTSQARTAGARTAALRHCHWQYFFYNSSCRLHTYNIDRGTPQNSGATSRSVAADVATEHRGQPECRCCPHPASVRLYVVGARVRRGRGRARGRSPWSTRRAAFPLSVTHTILLDAVGRAFEDRRR